MKNINKNMMTHVITILNRSFKGNLPAKQSMTKNNNKPICQIKLHGKKVIINKKIAIIIFRDGFILNKKLF